MAGYDYPTAAQTLPGFTVGALLGFIAPAGTPKAVILKIQTDTARILATPDMKKRMEEFGMQPVASTPDQFEAFIVTEMRRWAAIIKDAKIVLE